MGFINANLNFEIPVECRVNIFSFLEKKDLALAARVSRNWKELSTINMLWKRFLYSEFPFKMQLPPKGMFKEKLKDLYQKRLAFVLEHRDKKVYIDFNAKSIQIFPRSLINSLNSRWFTLSEKIKMIRDRVDNSFSAWNWLLSHIFSDYTLDDEISLYENIKFLLRTGANPNFLIVNHEFPTPLFLAAFFQNKRAYDLLKRYGANDQITNSLGKRAIEYIDFPH